MDAVTRRKFLIRSGVVGAGALAVGAGAFTLADILATSGDSDADAKTLVVLTLYGGCDGLATVVPFGDSAYHDARGEMAYSGEQVLRLDEHTGLNPSLKGLAELYKKKELAVVRGVGYPQPDRSHFRSMDIWQTANPQRPGNTGWLGRWLDASGGDPRLAVSFEPVMPPLLAGEFSAGASVPVSGFKVPRGLPQAAVNALAQVDPGEFHLQARAAGCFADLLKVDEMMTHVKEAAYSDADDDDEPATGTGGNTSSLASQFELVAQCVEAGVSTRVFSVSLGGFDFHAAEKAAQERILGEVDKAVGAFVKRMQKTERGKQVVLAIYSEFGRRVKANASQGTDHGTASNVFLLGAGVQSGLHGEQPSLTDLDHGDLKFSLDFRDIYAALLHDVLDADPAAVLDGWKTTATGLITR